jgi:integrase
MLTDSQVKKAVSSARADAVLNDGAQGKGGGSLRLKIRVGARGTTATWFAWWQEGGKPKTATLGRYPDLSLADARVAAAKAVADAKNPAPAQVEESNRTVAKLFAGYINSMRQDGKSSADEVEGRLALASAALGPDKPAGDVTPADIAAVLKPIHDRGARVMADRMRAYLSAAFNWGIEATHDYRAKVRQDWGIKVNPAAQVKRDTKANTTRERHLSADELATLWAAMDGAGFADGTGAAIRLMICCGQRVRETMRLEGRDIDLEAGLWTMPAKKTKGGKYRHTIPLPAQALPILRQLIAKHGDGWLFPARHGESDLQLASSIGKAIRRWLVENGGERFQARDLRRTWKSRAGDAGVDRFVRDLIQQHAKNDTGSKHYDRTDYLPQMRQAMATWESWLSENVTDRKNQSHALAA